MPTRILVVDDNEMNLKLVSATLQTEGYQVTTARDGREALESIKKQPPALAILDVMMPDMDGYTLCRHFRREPSTATIPIIILTALNQVDDKIKAFDSGADDFMAKPFEPQELRARVKVLLRRASEHVPVEEQELKAKMIAVFSLRGGMGVSTLASNLAIGLSQIWGTPTTLVDMAFVSGQSALLLDLPLRNTWTDIGRSPADEIDPDLLNRVILRHSAGVNVLASPHRPEDAEVVTPEHVRQTLEMLRKQYSYIVLDLPHDFSETTLIGLDMADQILLMFAPEMASIRCAGNALGTFEQLEYPAEKISLVLNWPFKGKGLPRKEMETALKKEISVVIPHAGDSLVTAITLGKPPTLQTPLDPLGTFLEDLAYLYSRQDHKDNPPEQPGPGWKRVKDREKTHQAKST
ncbi:MAG: response regulator [Chloroflexi bacterium]|nr:response regulator [Chloroflexota bacterium]